MSDGSPWGGEIPEDGGETLVLLARDVDELEAGQKQLWRELAEVASMARRSPEKPDAVDAFLHGLYWMLGLILARALVYLVRGVLADGDS